MSAQLVKSNLEVLTLLRELPIKDIEEICTCVSNHLRSGLTIPLETKKNNVLKIAEFLILLSVDSSKENLIKVYEKNNEISREVVQVLANFVNNERNNVRGSLFSTNFQKYRLVHLEWRLEGILASRCLMKQKKVVATLKLHLCTESINSRFSILNHSEQNNPSDFNRKNIILEMPISSLLHVIQILEAAVEESRSRRIRNIVNTLHRN